MNGANTSRQQPRNTELDFHLDCSMVREHTARSQLKFVEMCLVAQDIVNCCTQPVDAWKEHGFSICWMRYKCQLHLLLVLRSSAAVLISSPASPCRSWRGDIKNSNFSNYTIAAIERRCWELQLLLLLVHFSISLHLFWLHVVFRSVWCTAILKFFVNLANGPR